MENKKLATDLDQSEMKNTPDSIPLGSFSAWYVLLVIVLIGEIIFFSWLTKTFA